MYPASRKMTFWEDIRSVWDECRTELILALILSVLVGLFTFCLIVAVQR